VADRRRLSESISEGDGISILVELPPHAAPTAELVAHAVGVLLPTGEAPSVASVPVAVRGGTPAEAGAAGADAWLLDAGTSGDALADLYDEASAAGLECIVEIHDEDELARVLEEIDPEILLLAPSGDDADPAEGVLELLPDVPAGKLAIGALQQATEDDLGALERAGVDAVLIDLEHAATLFSW
jgi:hypothetical protein